MHMHYHIPFFNYCCDPDFSLVNLNVEEYKQMNALPQCRYYSQDYRFHYAFASDVQMMLVATGSINGLYLASPSCKCASSETNDGGDPLL